MVFILDGSSEHVAHTEKKTGLLRRKKIDCDTTKYAVNKCFMQIK